MNWANCKKDELVKRSNFRCAHGHNGLAHPDCFNKKNSITKKLAFLDIETSNLKANWGFVFSYCLKEEDGGLIKRVLTPDEIKKGVYDKNLLKQFCEDVRKFDWLVGYYSGKFDIPFLRTRCVYHRLNFPIFKEIKHTDLYQIIKHKFNLHSRRLGVVSEFLEIEAKQHPMNPKIWFKAMAGDKEALNWIMTHNIEDVVSTEKLWERVNEYARITESSI